ncbi:MAG TPA: hypothetical protein VJ836_06290 [Candidatus Saccharimonadales bacterium]|nr:hypothetical protein [Candidatus Saccharimonadales bacterium]
MEIFILLILALIVGGIAYLVRSARKSKKTKTKEERWAESITAIIVLIIVAFFVFLKQTVMNDTKQDILRDANTSQTQGR